jgi:iron complex transport system substrate-binding protein
MTDMQPAFLFRASIRRSICAGLLAAAFANATAIAAPVTVKDASGRAVTINDSSRMVVIGGALTEILYALGLEQQIAAVDVTSVYPARVLSEKPNVGYMRALSPEGVLGMRPSLVLAIDGAGPKETIAVLEATGVPMVTVPDRFDAASVVGKIRLVAEVAGARAKGECLAAAVQSDFDALAALRTKINKPARVMFALSTAADKLMIAGDGTAADGIIRLAGGVNAIASFEGYKAVSDEAVIGAAPDALMVMQRGAHASTTEEIFSTPAFSMTPAAKHKTLISLDGLYLLGFGPRTALAARDVAARLYPELHAGKLPSEDRKGCR